MLHTLSLQSMRVMLLPLTLLLLSIVDASVCGCCKVIVDSVARGREGDAVAGFCSCCFCCWHARTDFRSLVQHLCERLLPRSHSGALIWPRVRLCVRTSYCNNRELQESYTKT